MTEYNNPDKFILNDLYKNSNANKKAVDGNMSGFKRKFNDNTLDVIDNNNSIYYNPYKQFFNNKVMDKNKGIPVYDYEMNGGRIPQFFTSKNNFRYITPPLEKASGAYRN